jgi:hypothetical protein
MRLVLALLLLGCTDRTDLLAGAGAHCDGPIHLGDECAGAAAARRLRYALCSCTALTLERGLFTEGGIGMRGPPPAAVGTNEDLQVAGPVQVEGAIEAAGLFGAAFGRAAGVVGTLRSGGTLSSNQFLSVAGNAFVDGNVVGPMDIGGFLHVPMGAFISGDVSARGFIFEPVEVKPPCDCGSGPDLPSLIASRARTNDNGSIHLSPDALVQTALDLPCGEFYLSQIRAPSELELRVHGRAALYVGGPVDLAGGLRVSLDSMAELDLVVGDDFSAQGVVGAASAQAVRLWLAGKTLHLGPYAVLAAAVYAPNAVVLADDVLNVNGALLAGSIAAPNDIRVHYDAAILRAGVTCGEMPQPAVQ